MNVVVVTVSDRCSKGEMKDEGGPLVCDFILKNIPNSKIVERKIIPDDFEQISKTIADWCQPAEEIHLLVTTGGTGLSARDVTPEATEKVLHRRCHGMEHAIMAHSLKITPYAMLSRLVCGIRNSTLIINLPGKPKGAVESLEAIVATIPHAVNLICDKPNQRDHQFHEKS